jgi:selenide,water dikinase
VLAGGHTLREEEPKFGLAVVGTVSPDAIWTKGGARAGDAVYLTKPLGTGLLVHGHGDGRTAPDDLAEAVRWMQVLNAQAADMIRPLRPNAVTDVTGFGLLGHAHELASSSGVAVELEAAALPALPGALELAAAGIRTGGDPRNREFTREAVTFDGASEAQVALAYDPQTAGGLLVSIPPSRGLEDAAVLGGLFLARIGSVTDGAGVHLVA